MLVVADRTFGTSILVWRSERVDGSLRVDSSKVTLCRSVGAKDYTVLPLFNFYDSM